MKNKKLLITSVASLLMLSSIVVGSTFALFTSESQTNISVTAGKVNVNSTIDGLVGNSYTSLSVTDGVITGTETGDILPVDNVITYPNNGTATYDPNTGSILLDRVTPGDSLKFTITIKNDSNVNVKYRVKSTCDGSVQLFDALDIKYDGESSLSANWKEWRADDPERTKTINVSIAVPDLSNAYQGLSTKIVFSLEAVQGNAYTEDEVLKSDMYMSNTPSVGTVVPDPTADRFYVETSDGLASAAGSMSLLNEGGKTVTYKVTPLKDKASISEHKVTQFVNQKAAMYAVEVDDEKGEFRAQADSPIDYRFYVGTGLDGVKAYYSYESLGWENAYLGTVVDRLDQLIMAPDDQGNYRPVQKYGFKYDKETGFVSFSMQPDQFTFNGKTKAAFVFVKKENKISDTSWFDSTKSELYINTVEDLKGFASLVNNGTSFEGKTVKLNADLDLKGVTINPIGGSYNPYAPNPFIGTFDGCGHTISNLSIESPLYGPMYDSEITHIAGLFGYMKTNEGKELSTIKNLNFDSPIFNTDGTSIGTLLGDCHGGRVENISVTNGYATRRTVKYFGGIVGHGNVEISNCYYQGKLESDTGVSNFGGIIGYSEGKLISKCFVDADFEAYGMPYACGGIVGMAVGSNGLQIDDCYVTGRLIATKKYENSEKNLLDYNIGGIAGLGTSVNLGLNNNYVDADLYYRQYNKEAAPSELVKVQTGYLIGNCNGDNGGDEMLDLTKFIGNSWKDDVNEYVYSGITTKDSKGNIIKDNNFKYDTITKDAAHCAFGSNLTYTQYLEVLKKLNK